MAVRRIDHHHINPRAGHKFKALVYITTDAQGRTNPELALIVLGRVGMLSGL
jgi:hypothetical protein